MKLQQDQLWKVGEEYVRITFLQRLSVDYKAIKDIKSKEGTHHRATKKEFCRLIKDATLLTDAEVQLLMYS